LTEYHCKYDELVDPSTLVDHPRNVHKHPRRQIDALMKFIEFSGWRHPIVVSRLSGRIVAGHARKMAAIERGDLAPVVYQDFASEAAERAMLRADNRLAELAEIDFELEQIEIAELAALDVPVLDFGFEIKEETEKSRKEIDPDRRLMEVV
jgi:ParB-like chromosome segregation protein Spo0J